MGFRLQRRIRLGKFVHLNISKSGVGFSAGVRGLRISHGPSGTHFTAGLPGTGLSYRKKLTGTKKDKEKNPVVKPQAKAEISAQTANPNPPAPGFFAARSEKELARAMEDYEANNIDEAVAHFIEAAEDDPGAGIMAAAILARNDGKYYEGIEILEDVIEYDQEFPTELMEKYLADMDIEVDITPNVTVIVPIDALAATLLLVELYQKQRRVREAIALLEEIESLANEPALTLSLVELYATRHLWDNIIDRVKHTEAVDDITLETLIFYGKALQAKELHEAAISIFAKAARRRKNRNPALINEANYWRAISYQAQGKQSKANTEFQKLYAEAPDFRDVAQRLEDFAVR